MTTRTTAGAKHDRFPDLARFGRPRGDRHMGGSIVSAEIVPFTHIASRNSERSNFSALFRSAERPDDLAMDHVDTAACDRAWFESQSEAFGDG
jgi:hypothetical protein